MDLEAVYAGLWTLLQNAVGSAVTTASRRWRHFEDVPPSAQPAMFLMEKTSSVSRKRGEPAIWTLTPDLYLYAHNQGDTTKVPGTLLNPIINAVVSALEPTGPDDTQTLGGLVDSCWIEGAIEVDGGLLGEQSVAIVPLMIRLPG